MSKHEVEFLIEKADLAINEERFDALVDMYSEAAVLVIKPGTNAVGKPQIKKAFEEIADYFNHTLKVKQAGLMILEAGDVALVLAKTVISTEDIPEMERKATYMFKKFEDKGWLCVVDNSYGHDLLND